MKYFLAAEFLNCKRNQGYASCHLLFKFKYWQKQYD